MVLKPTNTATRAAMSKRMESSATRRIRGPLLGRNSHLTLSCLIPGRLLLTRTTRARANQRRRRNVASLIHDAATARASPVDQLSRVVRMTDPTMSHRRTSLVVCLQLVQMRQTRHLQGRDIAANGIRSVRRQRSRRLCLPRHLELGRAIRSILQLTKRLRIPPMQLILLPRLGSRA